VSLSVIQGECKRDFSHECSSQQLTRASRERTAKFNCLCPCVFYIGNQFKQHLMSVVSHGFSIYLKVTCRTKSSKILFYAPHKIELKFSLFKKIYVYTLHHAYFIVLYFLNFIRPLSSMQCRKCYEHECFR
jgi:hypothetical protein